MKYFLGLLVFGILCRNIFARGLDNPVLDDFERRLVRLESRQFTESENLEHRMLKLETHLGSEKGEDKLEHKFYQISKVEKHDEDKKFIERLEKLEKNWERKLKEHLTELSAKNDHLSDLFSRVEKQVEEVQRKASLSEKTEKKSEDLKQQGFIPLKPKEHEIYPETGSGYGESEPEFGSGYGELESENGLPKPVKFREIGSKFYFFEKDEEKKKSWLSAVAYCKTLKAHLVSLQNDLERRVFAEYDLDKEQNYWIDINDRATEGKFISESTGNTDPFLKWGNYEPSSSPGDEDCVELNASMGHRMNDADCLSKNFYICELNLI